ncbi:MAG TPA: hypothetical protein VGY58_17365 [Gemmataceae bacterium]|jgi:hypothetical protein|nr:hypothetical protein [Gemmataceae bacterium]
MAELRSRKTFHRVLMALGAVLFLGGSLGAYIHIRAREVHHEEAQAAQKQRARQAYDELLRAAAESQDVELLVGKCDAFLRAWSGADDEPDVRRRRDAYLRRIEERDIEEARDYSRRHPLGFKIGVEHYRHYLDRYPAGLFADEARSALRSLEEAWDKQDFREVRDFYLAEPGQIEEIVQRCRAYQTAHPDGRFKSAAGDLLRWTERVSTPGEYRIVLRKGHFEKKIAHFFSRGPDLSVELEVGGARYGPSNIVVNSYDPEWNYEFPRRIRWKRGDPVRIRVSDHDYWDRVVVDISSSEGDPLAIGILAGDAWCGKNCITFESDFTWPALPKIE